MVGYCDCVGEIEQVSKANQELSVEVFSKTIRERRKEKGLTQGQLGLLLGIDQRTISALERNLASVSTGRFFEVLKALDIDVGVK